MIEVLTARQTPIINSFFVLLSLFYENEIRRIPVIQNDIETSSIFVKLSFKKIAPKIKAQIGLVLSIAIRGPMGNKERAKTIAIVSTVFMTDLSIKSLFIL